jgi:hypothetical protein
VPDLPGCVAAGHTLDETRELMRSALEMHLRSSARTAIQSPNRPTLWTCWRLHSDARDGRDQVIRFAMARRSRSHSVASG